ncbi:glutamate dehydrogenase/leucine dehydrogenase [Salibacterium salarium]|nr:glutamate dehydrogenase/leucine dehydrogenase [Salibacterium salarium]
MSESVTMNDIRDLAHVMSKKNSIMGIPLGGAKIGIVGDPESEDKDSKLQAFAKMAEDLLRTKILVGEDMGLTSSDVKKVYQSIQFDPSELVIETLSKKGIPIQLPAGKTVDDLLSKDFMDYLAGFGLLEAIEESAVVSDIDLTQSKVALQGFGTVGSGIAMLLINKGATISAISDVNHCVYRDEGFSFEELRSLQGVGGNLNISQLTNFKKLNRDKIFSLPVDIFVPASVSNVINSENASSIQAKLIVEGANLPTTKDAEKILMKQNKLILPDFVVNAGSAVGFGLLITGQAEFDDVFEVCATRIRSVVKTILSESIEKNSTPRKVAMEVMDNNMKIMRPN